MMSLSADQAPEMIPGTALRSGVSALCLQQTTHLLTDHVSALCCNPSASCAEQPAVPNSSSPASAEAACQTLAHNNKPGASSTLLRWLLR